MTDLTPAILAQAADPTSRVPLLVIIGYLVVLAIVGFVSTLFFRGTSKDYFVASRSIGPVMLLMSVFGTTMTAFALVGSTAKSFDAGIGVYGLMASSSGLIHALCFFLIGVRMWAVGKRYGYVTQIQYMRDRFESRAFGYLLFPILVGLIIPYLLVGLIGAGSYIQGMTMGMYPDLFPSTRGGIPPWLTGLVISIVVLFYVFLGGVRSAAWANTFQTIVFMVMGIVGFILISNSLGGLDAASQITIDNAPEKASRSGLIEPAHFISYMFIPLSVGMFPHLFQHWLTARSAKTFKLTLIAHPVFIMIVWVPCILLGMWAAGLYAAGDLRMPPIPGTDSPNSNTALSAMVKNYISSPLVAGLFSAGVLAAIMSSLDSQFVCIGSMFTNDIVVPLAGRKRFSDRQKIWLGRAFVVAVVAVTYIVSIFRPMHVFNLGVWCFSGFASLFPLIFAAVYWKRVTKAGAYACVLVTIATWGLLFYDALYAAEPFIGHKDPQTREYLVAGVMPVTFIFLASLISLVGVSLITKPLSSATITKFFPPN